MDDAIDELRRAVVEAAADVEDPRDRYDALLDAQEAVRRLDRELLTLKARAVAELVDARGATQVALLLGVSRNRVYELMKGPGRGH